MITVVTTNPYKDRITKETYTVGSFRDVDIERARELVDAKVALVCTTRIPEISKASKPKKDTKPEVEEVLPEEEVVVAPIPEEVPIVEETPLQEPTPVVSTPPAIEPEEDLE